jgi:hypothetical protein
MDGGRTHRSSRWSRHLRFEPGGGGAFGQRTQDNGCKERACYIIASWVLCFAGLWGRWDKLKLYMVVGPCGMVVELPRYRLLVSG